MTRFRSCGSRIVRPRAASRDRGHMMTAGPGGGLLPDELALSGGRIVSDGVESAGDILIRSGRIANVGRSGEFGSIPTIELNGLIVTPGMVDIHVHGAAGHEFVEYDHQIIDLITAELARHGVTSVLATLSSEPIDVIVEALQVLRARVGDRSGRGSRILGVHLEGPYLSQDQRGAHPADVVREPTGSEVELLLKQVGTLRMMTIAPEIDGAIEFIRTLAEAGVIISVGHSSAGPDVVRAAQAAGATHFTHLWSGMSNLARHGPWRHPGLIDVALASERMTAEIIADGRHLPAELMEIARRCFGDKLCLVSDAIMGAGLPEGTEFGSANARYRVQGGVAVVVGADSFAGATTLLDGAVRRVVKELGWGLPEVVRMVTETPARVIGEDHRLGRIAPGYSADLALWSSDLEICGSMIGGQWTSRPTGFASANSVVRM